MLSEENDFCPNVVKLRKDIPTPFELELQREAKFLEEKDEILDTVTNQDIASQPA